MGSQRWCFVPIIRGWVSLQNMIGRSQSIWISSKFQVSLEHIVRSWLKNQIKLKDKLIKKLLALPEETVLLYKLRQAFETVIESKFRIVVWNVTNFLSCKLWYLHILSLFAYVNIHDFISCSFLRTGTALIPWSSFSTDQHLIHCFNSYTICTSLIMFCKTFPPSWSYSTPIWWVICNYW